MTKGREPQAFNECRQEGIDGFSDSEMRYYNNRWANEARLELPPNPLRVNTIVQHVSILTENLTNPMVLDVGCGNGWILQALESSLTNQPELHGIEPSSEGVQNSKSLVPTATIYHSVVSKFKSELQFDIITCSEVIEHVEDREEFIEDLHTLLAPNGKIVLTTPNGRFRNVYFARSKAEPQPVENWSTKKELTKLLQQRFSIKIVETFDLEFWVNLHPSLKISRKIILKVKGGWRILNLIEKMACKHSTIGLYLICVLENRP